MTTEIKEIRVIENVLRRRRALLVRTLGPLALFSMTGCGETGDNATTNVQGGAARAPGAPPPKP